MPRLVDYLIIGQGIAGTSLAWHLLDKGKRIHIIDDPNSPSSSLVAAGMFNPLTGRKLVKTWLADTLFPYAEDFYTRIEKRLGFECFHPTGMYRPYRNEEERQHYLKSTSSAEYLPYVAKNQWNLVENEFIHAPYDGLSVTPSGWVNLPEFLTHSRAYFERLGSFTKARFSANDLVSSPYGWEWDQMHFKAVVNCMGVGAQNDPLFDWLPFNPVKGEILDCVVKAYSLQPIINQGIFILPSPKKEYVKVGATYSWHDLNWLPTSDGRNYLTEKLDKLLKVPYQIVGHQAGIRPSSKDRRPFLGRHPKIPNLYIFNGLGTKGVTLAPFFAQQLARLIVNEQELLPEVNIARYFSLYSNPGLS